MRVPVPTNEEIAFKQCLEMLKLNPLMLPTYYSSLFVIFKSLLSFEDIQRLNHMIENIEVWLSDDHNKLSLKEAEIRMYNNMDLKSGFQIDGVLITQLEIQQRLEEMKVWLTQKLYEYLKYIRFTSKIELI